MSDWKNTIRRFASDVEGHFDSLVNRLERRLNPDPAMVYPYLGYGNRQTVRVRGRVMEDLGLKYREDRDSLWENLANSYRRFATDEIPFASVRVAYGDTELTTTADDEGFFNIEMPIDHPLPDGEIWLDITLQVTDLPHQKADGTFPETTARALIPSKAAQYGIISDLDDTVIRSDVLNVVKLAKNTFLRNARTRLPFEGVAAFYRALRDGAAPNVKNPIYYVSSSPWNLYDLLTDFFEVREIPIGPLFLQDIGLNENQWITKSHGSHKINAIKSVMHMNPDLPFILIGDSGQHDPEIYVKIARENPQRVKAIYIRDVSFKDKRTQAITQFAQDLKPHNVPMLLVHDTLAAAQHAVDNGFIAPEALADVQAESKQDHQAEDVVL